jgi:hypothetical protein
MREVRSGRVDKEPSTSMSSFALPTMGQDNPRARWYVLAICCVALFMAILDNLIVNVALPTISDDLSPTTAQLQ